MASYPYDLVGGHPALDFLNTIHDWTDAEPRDYLTSFADAVKFGEAAGILSVSEARRLVQGTDERELARLGTLREVLERVIRSLIEGRRPRVVDLEALNASEREAALVRQLGATSDGVQWELREKDSGTAVLRLRLVDAALTLLTRTGLAHVKACPACGWFFLDVSRNQSRRWCQMATCGASIKASRYYWKDRT